jgi:4-amino-4-deoxy-L-arabinose transferase-like glycosyltransferase
MEAGKNMLHTGLQGYYPRSIGWPFLLSFAFAIFGLNPFVALYGSSVLGALTVINIFLLAFVLTRNRYLGLVSALVFAIMPMHIVWSASAETSVPSLFVITLTMIFCLLYCEKPTGRLLWLAALGLSFATMFRPENYIFPVLFLVGIWLFQKKFEMRLLLPLLVLALLALPNFVVVLNQHTSINFTENDSQGAITGSNFGFRNLLNNSLAYARYFVNGTFDPLLFGLLLIFGVLAMFLKERRNALFLVSWYLLLWFVYFFAWFRTLGGSPDLWAKARFFMMFYPVAVIFASYAVNSLQDLVPRPVSMLRLFIMPIFAIALVITSFQHYGGLQKEDPTLRLMTAIPELAERDIPSDCVIVLNAPELLSATTFLKTLKTSDFLFEPNRRHGCVLFFEDATCLDFGGKEDYAQCTQVKELCSLELYKSYQLEQWKYSFYLIKSCN